jgi:hypothetical protein
MQQLIEKIEAFLANPAVQGVIRAFLQALLNQLTTHRQLMASRGIAAVDPTLLAAIESDVQGLQQVVQQTAQDTATKAQTAAALTAATSADAAADSALAQDEINQNQVAAQLLADVQKLQPTS